MQLPSAPLTVDEILNRAGLRCGGATRRGSSFWSKFQLCPFDSRADALFADFEEEPSQALIVGTIVHEYLAKWYTTYNKQVAEEVIEYILGWTERELVNDTDGTVAMLHRCTQEAAHLARLVVNKPFMSTAAPLAAISDQELGYPPELVKAVEFPLEYSGDFEYSARIDLVLEMPDQYNKACVVISDTKTMYRAAQSSYDAYWQDLQFVGNAWLWNEVMVPKGFPPCRYIVADGIVKDVKHPSERFARWVYPVRAEKLAQFELQMRQTYQEFLSYQTREESLWRDGRAFHLWEAWPKRWASCQSRRYGRSLPGEMSTDQGQAGPTGGRCRRFEYCLNDSAYPAICTPQAPAAVAPPPPEPQRAAPALYSIALQAQSQQIAPPPVQIVPPPVQAPQPEPQPAPQPAPPEPSPTYFEDARAPGVRFRYPIPEDRGDILSMADCTQQEFALRDVDPGEVVYIRGSLYWATDRVNPDGNRQMIFPGCPMPIGVSQDTVVNIAFPILREQKKQEEDEQVVEEPEDRQPTLPSTSASDAVPVGERRSPAGFGEKVGEAPISQVGIVPVYYLGSYTRGGKLLNPNIDALWERYQHPFYAAAMVGREATSRSLKLFCVKSAQDRAEVTKGVVGGLTWDAVIAEIGKLTGGAR